MGALLGFLPFIVFALAEKVWGATPGLAAGALTSVALLLRDRLRGEREINLLEAGSAIMFCALTGVVFAGGSSEWSIWRVRLWVDFGLTLIVLASVLLKRPFTLHYARRQVAPEVANSARFLRINTTLSMAWAVAFTLLSLVDLLMVLRPEAPLSIAVGVSLSALAGAAWFTRWFSSRARQGFSSPSRPGST